MSAQLEVATVEEKRLDAEQKVEMGRWGACSVWIYFNQLFDFKFRGKAAFAPYFVVISTTKRDDFSECLSREGWLSWGSQLGESLRFMYYTKHWKTKSDRNQCKKHHIPIRRVPTKKQVKKLSSMERRLKIRVHLQAEKLALMAMVCLGGHVRCYVKVRSTTIYNVAMGGCKSWPKHIKIIKVHQAANKNDSSNNRRWPFDWKTMEKYQGFHGVICRFARQSVPWSSLQALRLKAKKEDDLEEERQAAEAWPKLLEQWRKTADWVGLVGGCTTRYYPVQLEHVRLMKYFMSNGSTMGPSPY